MREIAETLALQAVRHLDKREFGLVVAKVRNAMPRLSDRLEGELREGTKYWQVKKRPLL